MRNNLNNNYKFTQINNNLCSEETIVWDSEKKEWIIKINNNIFDIKENNNESDDIQKHDNKSMHILDSLISIKLNTEKGIIYAQKKTSDDLFTYNIKEKSSNTPNDIADLNFCFDVDTKSLYCRNMCSSTVTLLLKDVINVNINSEIQVLGGNTLYRQLKNKEVLNGVTTKNNSVWAIKVENEGEIIINIQSCRDTLMNISEII